MGALAPRASSPDDRGFALGPLSVCPPAKQLPFSQDCPTAAAAAALLAQRRAPGDLCRPGDYEGHSSRRGQALPSQGRRGGASRPSRVGPGCLRPSRRAPSRRKEGGACLASPRLTCLQRGPQVRRRTWAKSMMTTHEKTSAAQAKRPPPSFTQRSWAGRGPLYSELRPSEASKGLAWGWRGRKQPAAPPPPPVPLAPAAQAALCKAVGYLPPRQALPAGVDGSGSPRRRCGGLRGSVVSPHPRCIRRGAAAAHVRRLS